MNIVTNIMKYLQPTSNMGDFNDPNEAQDQPTIEFDRGDQPSVQDDPLEQRDLPRGRGDQPNQRIEDQSTQTEPTESESEEEEAQESCGHIGRYCIIHRKCDLCKVGDPAECPDCRDDDYDSDPPTRRTPTLRAKSDLDSQTIIPRSDPVTTKASVCIQADSRGKDVSQGVPQETEQADSRGQEVSTGGPQETEENSQESEKTEDTEDGDAVNDSTSSNDSITENSPQSADTSAGTDSDLIESVDESPSPITVSSTSNNSNSETTQVSEELVKEQTKTIFGKNEKNALKRSFADDIKLLPPQVQEIIPLVTGECLNVMGDLSDRVQLLLTENAELKLQLNAAQQAKAGLELEIGKKDEIILKTEAEALKNEQLFKQEVKQLREQLKENSKTNEKDDYKELEEQLKLSKAREAKALNEVTQKVTKEGEMQATMDNYVATIKANTLQIQQLDQELNSTKTHLANLELAFSDVHLKYEKTKELLKVRSTNEDNLNSQLAIMRQTRLQDEERYEALKAHAHGQIDKANRENINLRNESEDKLAKLTTIIKRFDIKVKSLEQSLQQKMTECEALASLCDEVTGKKNSRTVH